MKSQQHFFKILVAFLLLIVMAVFLFVDPIVQDLSYHNFADTREILAISNFWNVLSNVPYFVVGLWALHKLHIKKSLTLLNEINLAYILLFVGVTLVSFGSGYYHLDPNNETLVWDRLPMTIAFMALFSVILSEFVAVNVGKKLLFPLLVLGFASVLYWYVTELSGHGDLRSYALVQFLPILMIPLLLLLFSSSHSHIRGYWLLLICYLLAKVFEHFDAEIYDLLVVISGHSLKHMVSALGLYFLLSSFEKREELGK